MLGPSTASKRTGHGRVSRSGAGRSSVVWIVTGVCGSSAPVRVVRVRVPTPLTVQPVFLPTPTAHLTSSPFSGRCTTSVDRSIGICHPLGIRFQ